MNLWETFTLALRNIFANKLRTGLTMLGIIIGVTAVTIIVGLGNGMENYMRDQFASLGTNTLTAAITGRGTSRRVSVEDMYAIAERHGEYFAAISPTVGVNGGVKIGNESLPATTVHGVSEDYLAIRGMTVARGRGLQYMDILDRKTVCLVGSYVNDTYYNGNAVGQTIRAGGSRLRIVGVLEQRTDEPEKGGDDDAVYLPYSTAARLSKTGDISSYVLMLTDERYASEGKTALEEELYRVFGDTDAYMVMSTSEILSVMTGIINVVITVLAVIAAISLVVGGIGIMNIMLVSVTERTREIGIRKALGAKERMILGQFIMEAAATSALGGVLGIVFGYLLSALATTIIRAAMHEMLTVTPSAPSVALAFGVSAGIGVLFGWLPARKAARLNPIDALRYE
ncbi:MAG: ABC transporter permease [Oscillospiraceae bacterium]|nr:ABC transporter permease [Oscillospiraceae bacterium]